MKILYIGNYRDGTGWGNAAIGYIMALDAVGIEVVPRCLRLNQNDVNIPDRIKELENNKSNDCDIIIQHVLPHYLDFRGEFEKNIALYVTETSHFKNCSWPERINLMDEAWVPNRDMTVTSRRSDVQIPMRVVPHAFDMEIYQKTYEPFDIPELKDKFVFYYVGEISRRKNIGAIVKAFHLEFGPEEPVSLLLKAFLPGQPATASDQHLKTLCDGIKDGLKLYPDRDAYHSEVFLSQYLTNEQVMRVHATGDCFVTASFGEAWCIPAFDAMAMGKTPICPDDGGPKDFIKNGGWLVKGRYEPCYGAVDTFQEMYVGNEDWFSVDIHHLMYSMRGAYEDKS